MKTKNSITVRRHSLLYRLLHWSIVAFVILLILSGLSVSEYIPLALLARGTARNLHILIGLIWTGTVTFFIYYFIVSGEYKWFGVSRIGEAFDFFMHEVKYFVSGKKVKSPVGYDAHKNKYKEKIVPTEVLAWWGWVALWIIMIFTGMALLFPGSLLLIQNLCHAILPGAASAAAATRFIHLSVSIIIVLYIMIHAYASWSFGMAGSMISGVNEEPVVTTEKA